MMVDGKFLSEHQECFQKQYLCDVIGMRAIFSDVRLWGQHHRVVSSESTKVQLLKASTLLALQKVQLVKHSSVT